MKLSIVFSLCLLSLLAAVNDAYSQEKQEQPQHESLVGSKKNQHSLGAIAGFTTGFGLSYRYTRQNFATQLAFCPMSNSSQSRNSVGLTFLFYLSKKEKANFFLYEANHLQVIKDKYYSGPFGEPQTYKTTKFNCGLGFGIGFIIAKSISLDLMGGYGSFNSKSKWNSNNSGRYGPTGEISLLYHL
jgi:hypothetical protein